MIEVEQNKNSLNLLAEAGLNEKGDANRAWSVIAQCVDDGTPFPRWVMEYLREVAGHLKAHDANSSSDQLATALEFFPDKRVKQSKSKHDMLEVASTISMWRRKDTLSGQGEHMMDHYYSRYIIEKLTGREKVETIKSLYYKGLEALLTELEQNIRLDDSVE